MQLGSVGDWLLIAGAVGTASMGLVEAGKLVSFRVGNLAVGLGVTGLGAVRRTLGRKAQKALRFAYGPEAHVRFLEGAWRKGAAELESVLKKGLLMAAHGGDDAARAFVADLGHEPDQVAEDVKKLREGTADAAVKQRIERLEAAIDARVQAAVAAGRDQYVAAMQFTAMVVSIGGCLLLSEATDVPSTCRPRPAEAILIGLLAVPLAPVAKDIASFLTNVRSAFQKGKPAG